MEFRGIILFLKFHFLSINTHQLQHFFLTKLTINLLFCTILSTNQLISILFIHSHFYTLQHFILKTLNYNLDFTIYFIHYYIIFIRFSILFHFFFFNIQFQLFTNGSTLIYWNLFDVGVGNEAHVTHNQFGNEFAGLNEIPIP